MSMIDVRSYSQVALPNLQKAITTNEDTMKRLVTRLVDDVRGGKSLLVFGSGHSAIFTMELYHRAGGAAFVVPIIADYLLPTAGPPVVRLLERTPGAANVILNRMKPQAGEMIWISSQSGINGAVVEFALECKKRGLFTVAFTSKAHSSSVSSRHPSGKRLFEVCDETIDLCGVSGDASVPIGEGVSAGPLSTLTMVTLGHSMIVAACAELERSGHRCVYTSVNTPEGEKRNHALEVAAQERDYLLR